MILFITILAIYEFVKEDKEYFWQIELTTINKLDNDA